MSGARDYNPPPPFFSSSTPFNHQIQESAAAKAYDAELKWFSSPEAKQRSAAAKAHALAEFKKRFPRANMSKFITQVDFDASRKAIGRVLFPVGDGSWEDALIEDSKYWSQPLKAALGCNKMVAFLISYHCGPHNHKRLIQFQQSLSQTPQGKASRISLTSR